MNSTPKLTITSAITAVLATIIIMLQACSVSPQVYKNETPMLDMREYFNGNIQAWGIFRNYNGQVTKRFIVNIEGNWDGNQGTLNEMFSYSDGTTQQRIWNLIKHGENGYSGTAADVIGEARGASYGNTLRWQYTLEIESDGSIYHVHFDDWMYRIDEDVVLNHSIMSKFGITVGEVIIAFRKTSTSKPFNSSLSNMPFINHVNDQKSYFL